MVRSTTLPRLVLIADGFAAGHPTRGERWPPHLIQLRAFAAVAAGVEWVQLRDHEAPPEGFEREARRFRDDVHRARPNTLLSVNTHLDTARRLRLSLHLGHRGRTVAEARRHLPQAVLSVAVHSVEEAVESARAGADAVLFSPVFPTASKPHHPGTGLDALAACCAAVPTTPVFALGGIMPDRVADCLHAGAYGVAVLSALLFPPGPGDIFDAVQAFRDALALPPLPR